MKKLILTLVISLVATVSACVPFWGVLAWAETSDGVRKTIETVGDFVDFSLRKLIVLGCHNEKRTGIDVLACFKFVADLHKNSIFDCKTCSGTITMGNVEFMYEFGNFLSVKSKPGDRLIVVTLNTVIVKGENGAMIQLNNNLTNDEIQKIKTKTRFNRAFKEKRHKI